MARTYVSSRHCRLTHAAVASTYRGQEKIAIVVVFILILTYVHNFGKQLSVHLFGQ